jgi:hypothetical protein
MKTWITRISPIKPAAGSAGSASQLTIWHHGAGVPEPESSVD